MSLSKQFQTLAEVTEAMFDRLEAVMGAPDGDPSRDPELLALQNLGNALSPDMPGG